MPRVSTTPAWKRSYCRRARQLRDELTEKRLAEKLGLTVSQVRHYARGCEKWRK
jgi:hypothetical protein